ncbi:MAG: 3-oxoacyl-[acyl-carrier-protein] reductase [Candidatus Marinimicrobia bacterium]|nr:3-oxoacyl-[acyl-carrier-protein] reductase [Candidatus Neomarinimicrobiota bacterium]MDD5710352.1 3-oxoacyl-[acyl-carrier-protein] reductase [Candidatus Neomarinimicrobiota bacterium]
MDLKGKVALVTGAAGGIGEAICTALARSGASVLIHYCHSEAPAKALSDKLRQEGHSCMLYQADIRSTQAAQAMADALIAEYGKIDILVNNAGITRDQLLMRMSEADFDEVIATNLKGSWNMIKAVSYAMSKARYGKIINISSVAGIAGTPGQSNYAASKAGIIGLTKSVAREFARRNITCNAVAPGFIETKMSAVLPEAVREKYLEQIPLARYGKPEEVAALVLYLASDEANYITGQVLQIDGGLAM